MGGDSSSSSLDFSFGLEKDSGGGGSNVVTSTQTCAAPAQPQGEGEKEDERPAKLSERTLSALREFQASQPVVEGVPAQPGAAGGNTSKDAKPATRTPTTQPKTLQAIFADPNDDFDFEL